MIVYNTGKAAIENAYTIDERRSQIFRNCRVFDRHFSSDPRSSIVKSVFDCCLSDVFQ